MELLVQTIQNQNIFPSFKKQISMSTHEEYVFKYNENDFSIFSTDKGEQYAKEQVMTMLKVKYNRTIHEGDVILSNRKERNDYLQKMFENVY